MDHDYIAAHDLVGRYVSGDLEPDERTRFEEHFIDCPRCLDALETAEPFRRAVVATAVADTGSAPVAPIRTARRSRLNAAVYGVAGLAAALVVAVGAADLVRTLRALARVSTAAATSERERADAERRVRELTTQVETLGRREASVAAPPVPMPMGAVVFTLVEVRSDGGGPPQNRVTLSGARAWVILLVDLDTPPTSNQYRARIETTDGQRVWSGDGLTASLIDTLAVAVQPDVLVTGDYALVLEERAAGANAWHPAGRYTFRVASR
jgi:hypothetical protein